MSQKKPAQYRSISPTSQRNKNTKTQLSKQSYRYINSQSNEQTNQAYIHTRISYKLIGDLRKTLLAPGPAKNYADKGKDKDGLEQVSQYHSRQNKNRSTEKKLKVRQLKAN